MKPLWLTTVARHALAVALVIACAFVLKVPEIDGEPGSGIILLMITMLLAAWAGGRGPGLTATAFVALTTWAPQPTRGQVVRHLLFIGAGALISQLVGSLAAARRRAEAAAARWRASDAGYRRLLETANEGIWVLDAEGRATYVNARGAAMVGVDAADLMGRSLGDLTYTPAGGEELAQALAPLREGRRTRFDLRLRRKDGSARWVRVSASPAPGRDGGTPGALAMLADVTDRVEAEEALRRSESRVRRLSESGMIGVAFLDPGGRVTEANDEFLRLVGQGRDDLAAGRVSWSAATPPAYREQDRRMLEELRGSGACGPFVKELARADGGRSAVMVGAARLDREGPAGESVSFVLDVSARRRAEEAVRLLAEAGEVLGGSLDDDATLTAVAALAVPRLADVCVIDVAEADGRVRRVAAAHADPAPREAGAELPRRDTPDPAGPWPVAEVLRTGRTYLAPEVGEGAPRTAARDEARRPGVTSVMVVPLAARGRVFGAISLGVTGGSRRYDAEDLGLAEELARRAGQAVDNARLFAEAQQARFEAEAANRSKDQFLAVLSHELRNPLTPVLIGVSALLDDPETPASVRPVLEVTRRNVALEARLIDDLLDVTRIAQGKLRLETRVADAHELVRQAVAICRDDLAAAGLRLDLDLSAERHHVRADPARLQQIVWNLVKNAVKFTPVGGRVSVRSRSAGGDVVVEVEDTGVGIDPEVLPRIFNAFEQGEASVTKQFGGLGLGLAISRSLAEAHGGRLTAASPGRGLGATFTLALPAAPAPAAEESRSLAPAGADGDSAPLRILLAEDNADTLRLMARLLRGRGHRVATADGVEAAVRVAESEGPFDLVISDIGLPDGTGNDLMRQLRRRGPVPGIALSGYGTEDDLRQSREAGFHTHLIKPVDFAALEAAIRDVAAAPVE